jgi:dTDP-3-amino-3,4,6-trideoxy-alpha-D-glucose transaminase
MYELLGAVEGVALSAAFTLGDEVRAFEEEFAQFCGVGHAIGVASGTDALALSLRALGVGPGDEVIVPANSFIATAEAVSLCGATPRFADVDADTQLITAETLQAALGPRVRAVIPVHLFGRTVEIEPIAGIARERGLRVIEDAAQAHGAIYRERRVGSLADCGCFSFYPSKNLGAWGDGGAVTTDDAEFAEHLRLLRSHGERRRYEHVVPGATARLDAVQAAVLCVKLRRLDASNAARRRIARRLDEALAELFVIPPAPGRERDHVYHQYVIRHPARDELRDHLTSRGVQSAVHYPIPIHRTPAYATPGTPALPVAERLSTEICSLPMYPSMTASELDQIIDACTSFTLDTWRPGDEW